MKKKALEIVENMIKRVINRKNFSRHILSMSQKLGEVL
jgi:hypothetical protein